MIFPAIWAMGGLTPAAKVVLGGIAIWGRGAEDVALSHGFLAGQCGLRRSTVAGALDALEDAGLIQKYGAMQDQVQPYRVLFAPMVRTKRGVAESAAPVVRKQEGHVMVACLKCRKQCRPSAKTGWCRKCTKDSEMDARIRRIAGAVVMEKAG